MDNLDSELVKAKEAYIRSFSIYIRVVGIYMGTCRKALAAPILHVNKLLENWSCLGFPACSHMPTAYIG